MDSPVNGGEKPDRRPAIGTKKEREPKFPLEVSRVVMVSYDCCVSSSIVIRVFTVINDVIARCIVSSEVDRTIVIVIDAVTALRLTDAAVCLEDLALTGIGRALIWTTIDTVAHAIAIGVVEGVFAVIIGGVARGISATEVSNTIAVVIDGVAALR